VFEMRLSVNNDEDLKTILRKCLWVARKLKVVILTVWHQTAIRVDPADSLEHLVKVHRAKVWSNSQSFSAAHRKSA
jgi:hypothetical protein